MEAIDRNNILRYIINMFISKWKDVINPAEYRILRKAIDQHKGKLANFRMSLKAHKKPWKMRPIVCCSGTLLNCLSRWIDCWLQTLKPHIASYIKDSSQFLERLRKLGILTPDSCLFMADVDSMYTNIDTKHALEVIGIWLTSLNLPDNFPS
jgi:hypothetical protein